MKNVLISFCFALAACSVNKPPADAPPANAPAVYDKVTVKVMSYNIHHANPPSQPGIINLDTIAAIIRQQAPDFVALQEVDVRTKRSGTGIDQAAYLAQKLGMHHFFAKAIDYEGGEYGVAVLSKHPIKAAEKLALPIEAGSGAEPRVVAKTTVTLPNKEDIVFASTHLDFRSNSPSRQLQVQEIIRIFQAEQKPVILAGDFNDTPNSETMQALQPLFTKSCEQCPFTIPQVSPNRTIDYILFSTKSGWRASGHQVLSESFASDHLPIVATLQKN